jgi:hypothetical protein
MKKISLLFAAFISATLSCFSQVGIGTTNPTAQLELTQSLKFPATTSNLTGIIFKGNYPFLHDYKGGAALGFNTFLGVDAGNFTSGGGSDYLGCNNTGLGFYALHGVSTGYANTAVGSNALSSNTNGAENTAMGVLSMYFNTSGSRNTTIGYLANHFNQTGSFNTMIGFEAGTGTAGQSKSGNVFIGYRAGKFEAGSNKLYIENSDAPSPLIGGDFTLNEVYISGKLGIGTSLPSTALHVAGSIRIADGTQAAGRILMGAADGTAAWGDPIPISDGDWTVSGNNIYPAVSGNVGIGVTNPLQQLEIAQSLRMPVTTTSTTGVIYKGDLPFIHDFKIGSALGYNTYLGMDAGNFNSGSGADYQGSNNTGLGFNALHSISTGYANTAAGSLALYGNTTGIENTAVGLQTMYTNSTGGKNTAIGYMAIVQILTIRPGRTTPSSATKQGKEEPSIQNQAMFLSVTRLGSAKRVTISSI